MSNGSVVRKEVIKISYYYEPEYDEYGFPEYETGVYATPSQYMFEEGECYGVGPGGEAIIENWAQVAPGYYISDSGNLYSFKTEKYLKPKKLDKRGHVGYTLYIDGKRKYFYQHRLIAEAFIAKDKETDNVVRHLNDIPDDNDPYNLAWGTQRENREDAERNGTAYYITDEDREKGFELIRKPTRAINLKTGEVREYISLNEAVRDLGVQQSNAQKVVSGKRSHTCGWKFEYIEEE